MCYFFLFFFFKQKTAYEMRISDWSSDVCSSDLGFWICRGLEAPTSVLPEERQSGGEAGDEGSSRRTMHNAKSFETPFRQAQWLLRTNEIGRASCRERVGQYV